MNLVWLAVGAAVAIVAGTATVIRFKAVGQGPPASPDLGTVSDGWLSENRSRKDS